MKRKVFAVVAGFSFWFAVKSAESLFWIFMMRRLTPSEFGSFVQLTKPIFSILDYLTTLLAGFMAGWVAREKGWFYGCMVGVPLILGVWSAEMLKYFVPEYLFGPAYLNVYKPGTLFSFSFLRLLLLLFWSTFMTFVYFGLGGLIGEKLHKYKARSSGRPVET